MEKSQLRHLLDDIKKGLYSIYGRRLAGVYLFGSYARGDHNPESDLDILIVLPDFDSHITEIERTGELISDLSLEYGVSISRKFTRKADWIRGDNILLRNVRKEAIKA
jgi:uncharacterized protein